MSQNLTRKNSLAKEKFEVQIFHPKSKLKLQTFDEDSIDPDDILIVGCHGIDEVLYKFVVLTNGIHLLVDVAGMFVELPNFNKEDPVPYDVNMRRHELISIACEQDSIGNTVYRFSSVKAMLSFLIDKV